MRTTLILATVILLLASCKKDKFTTVPQIEYKSVDPNFTTATVGAVVPEITFRVRDAEGDLGLKAGSDTAFIYLKNNLTGKSDSLPFPNLSLSAKNNFQADVSVAISKVLDCRSLPNGELHIDTLYFDIYVKDFAKNKSNVITTGDPIYFNCR